MPPLPAHIVSLNLCADQYLLALADRGQIAAVTRFAADPGMSAAAGAAVGVPATRATAEELLVLAPDLLLVAPYQVATKTALLPRTRIVAVPEANDVAQIEANLATVAAAVGHPERGRALIASLRASLPPIVPGRRVVVAQYQRGGYLTGTGTLVDDLMRRVGVTNLARVLDRPPLSRLSLEAIIAAKPDYLLTTVRRRPAADRGAAMIDHPALARAFPPARRLTLDSALIECGGPGYARAITALRAQLGQQLVGAAPKEQ